MVVPGNCDDYAVESGGTHSASWRSCADADSTGYGRLDETYRGYTIRMTRSLSWHAVLVEPGTDIVLPTMATALLREGPAVALSRARKLIDIYADAEAVRRSHAA